jgi:hypothetical protein
LFLLQKRVNLKEMGKYKLMEEKIKFKNMHNDGESDEASFEAGEKDIKIRVTSRFLAVHPDNLGKCWSPESFLPQFGELIIRKMLAENKLPDNAVYTFEAQNFKRSDGNGMSLEEIKEKIEDDIAKAEQERDSIGFKT